MSELLEFLIKHPGIVFTFGYDAVESELEICCTMDDVNVESSHTYDVREFPYLLNNIMTKLKENYNDFVRNYFLADSED